MSKDFLKLLASLQKDMGRLEQQVLTLTARVDMLEADADGQHDDDIDPEAPKGRYMDGTPIP